MKTHQVDIPGQITDVASVFDLVRVIVADHAPAKSDVPLAGEADHTRANGAVFGFAEAPFAPMAVRAEDAGERSCLADGFVEVAADEEAGSGFEMDFADGVIFVLDGVEDFGMDGRPGRHRIEAGADEDMGLEPSAIFFPFLFGIEKNFYNHPL